MMYMDALASVGVIGVRVWRGSTSGLVRVRVRVGVGARVSVRVRVRVKAIVRVRVRARVSVRVRVRVRVGVRVMVRVRVRVRDRSRSLDLRESGHVLQRFYSGVGWNLTLTLTAVGLNLTVRAGGRLRSKTSSGVSSPLITEASPLPYHYFVIPIFKSHVLQGVRGTAVVTE